MSIARPAVCHSFQTFKSLLVHISVKNGHILINKVSKCSEFYPLSEYKNNKCLKVKLNFLPFVKNTTQGLTGCRQVW